MQNPQEAVQARNVPRIQQLFSDDATKVAVINALMQVDDFSDDAWEELRDIHRDNGESLISVILMLALQEDEEDNEYFSLIVRIAGDDYMADAYDFRHNNDRDSLMHVIAQYYCSIESDADLSHFFSDDGSEKFWCGHTNSNNLNPPMMACVHDNDLILKHFLKGLSISPWKLDDKILKQSTENILIYTLLDKYCAKEDFGEVWLDWINFVNEDGNTALHIAAQHGSINCVKLLVSLGCSVTTRNRAELAAIDLARANNHAEVVGFLEIVGRVQEVMERYDPGYTLLEVLLTNDLGELAKVLCTRCSALEALDPEDISTILSNSMPEIHRNQTTDDLFTKLVILDPEGRLNKSCSIKGEDNILLTCIREKSLSMLNLIVFLLRFCPECGWDKVDVDDMDMLMADFEQHQANDRDTCNEIVTRLLANQLQIPEDLDELIEYQPSYAKTI